MKVQRIEVENKPYPLYLLLDKEYQLIEPVMKFIKYLDNTGKSPNTIKAYCYHLKLLYEFMEQRGVILNDINFELLADFVGWLRYPSASNVIDLQSKKAIREETTVNTILNVVMSFLDYLSRLENLNQLMYLNKQGKKFQRILTSCYKGRYQKNVLKLRVKKKQIRTLRSKEVKQIIDACHTKRDKLILMLMYEGGLRIGEVLSLRLEDIVTWDNQIHLTPRDVNVNEAYIKLRKERTIHVSKELMSLYTDYDI